MALKIFGQENLDIVFSVGGRWIMTICESGIIFNRKDFPEWKPDDFAENVINLMSSSWDVEFKKRNKGN